MAHYYLNPSYQHLNIIHAVNAADFLVPSTFLCTLICVVMHIMTSSHRVHTKAGLRCVTGIQFLTCLTIIIVETCLYIISQPYYVMAYFVSSCCISIFFAMNGCYTICALRYPHFIKCIKYYVLIIPFFTNFIAVIEFFSTSTLITGLPNTNQESWENVAHFSYISVGNLIFFALQFPLYSIIFLFTTIKIHKMYIAITNKKHHNNELKQSESLLPIVALLDQIMELQQNLILW